MSSFYFNPSQLSSHHGRCCLLILTPRRTISTRISSRLSSRTSTSSHTAKPTNVGKSDHRPASPATLRSSNVANNPERPLPTVRTSNVAITPKRPLLRRSSSLAICDALDGFINDFIAGPPSPAVDPRRVLSGNFLPVPELSPTSCPVVKGSIPPCLAGGAYVRNGPNPQHLPHGPHHLFDGDGMLHSLLLPAAGGRNPATFCSRFVQTNRLLSERRAGGVVLSGNLGSMHGLPGLARVAVKLARVASGQINASDGVGVANTSLLYFAGRLLALEESDLPYAVRLSPATGDVATIRREDFGGGLVSSMTAHPKKDPVSGELFAFRHGLLPPFLTYFWLDRSGRKRGEVPVLGVRDASFIHDFFITRRYAVFADTQIVMNSSGILRGGLPVGVNGGKVPRVGVLPRYAASDGEMRWFNTPGFNSMHTVNAWEEEEEGDDVVVLVAPNLLSVEHFMERQELGHSCMEMLRINLRDGTVSRSPLSAWNLDFPVINPLYIGRRNRFAYAAIGDPQPKVLGVVKLDYGNRSRGQGGGECVVAVRRFGEGCYGSEPFFVPNNSSSSSSNSNAIDGKEDSEDDGYLVSYVHDEGRNESRFVVMDARSPDLEIVAEVLLPRRVPYGFHGLFVTESELKGQCI